MTELEKAIGYQFKDKSLLDRALTHSSYANEVLREYKDNERLEFLGDSVLGFITAEYLFSRHEDFHEGELSKLRSYAVCEKSLFEFAKTIGLGDYIKLSHGEDMTGGRNRPSVLSDAFEAVIAAIYLDGGIDEAKKFVLRFVAPYVEKKPSFKDYKTILQEMVQSQGSHELSYRIIEEKGPDHCKEFVMACYINGKQIGMGTGRSKK